MLLHRRQVLQAVGSGVILGIAGCVTGRTPASSPTESTTPTATPRRPLEKTATIPATEEIGFGSTAWRQFAHDTYNSGSNTGTNGPRPPLGLAWEATIPGEKPTFTSPAVVDGQVFFGNSNNRVHTVDAVSGEERWSYETGRFVASSPAVTEDAVYVGSADFHVYGLDREDGTLMWSTPVDVKVDHGVTAAEGVVYAGGRRGENEGAIHALDAADGTIRWTHQTEGWMWTTPAVGHGAVVFADEGAYRAVDLDDGHRRWALGAFPSSETAPVIGEEAIYVATGVPRAGRGMVSAREPETGEALWSTELVEGHPDTAFSSVRIPSSMALDGDALYVVLNGEWEAGTLTPGGMPVIAIAGLLYKLDVTTQEVVWATNLGVGELEGPTVVDGNVYVGGFNGLSVVDAGDGTVRWSRTLPEDIRRPPAVANGVVYVGTSGKLLALAGAD